MEVWFAAFKGRSFCFVFGFLELLVLFVLFLASLSC